MGEMKITDAATKSLAGHAQGKPENWRKMSFKRPFSTAELMVMDSEWDFIHAKGKFKVEFRADAYNHFVCNDFPAHSHWKLLDDTPSPEIEINFDKYGIYVLKVSADGQTMEGSAKGQPDNWRKCVRLDTIENR